MTKLNILCCIFFLNLFLIFNTSAVEDSDKITLGCRAYASPCDENSKYCVLHSVLCEIGRKIIKDEIVEVKGLSLRKKEDGYENLNTKIINHKEIEDSKVVIIGKKTIVQRLPQNMGSHFKQLETLIAMDIGLETIHKDDFKNMENLKSINLGDNQLTQIPENVFEHAKNLATIYLDGNILQKLDDKVFSGIPRLARIFLQNNRLVNVGKIFGDDSSIEEIYLKNNKLETVDIEFVKLKNLIFVEITDTLKFSTTFLNKTQLENLDTELKGFQNKVNDHFKNATSRKEREIQEEL